MLQSLEALHRIPSAPLISGTQVNGGSGGRGAEHRPTRQPPFPGEGLAPAPSSRSQPSATAERPKKGRRSTKIWCTQSFAKDDTIGRVRGSGRPTELCRLSHCQGTEPPGALLTPMSHPPRWAACTAPSPTSRATWSRPRASCPSASPPSTASCRGASGSWPRKVGWGWGD